MSSSIGRRRSAALDEGTDAYRIRRQQIIDAAAQVFKRRGYERTNLSEIAKEAGTDRATVYYYVSGKAELFDEVVSGAVESNTLLAERVRSESTSAPAKLRAMIEALMLSYAENFPYLYVYVQENLAHVAPERAEWSRRMRQLNHRYEDALIGIIRDGIEEGTLRATGDPRIMAYGILGTLGWTSRWFNPSDPTHDAKEIACTFADSFLDGMTHRDDV